MMSGLKKFRFSGTRCQLCYDKRRDLKRCSQCQVMPYCCKEHQQADWPYHKKVCKYLQQALEKAVSARDIKGYRALLQFSVKMSKGSLDEYEQSLIRRLPCCDVCNDHKNLIYCQGCFCAAYCSHAHRDSDRESHAPYCADLKIWCEIDEMGKKKMPHIIYKDMNGYARNINEVFPTCSDRISEVLSKHLASPFATIMHGLRAVGCKTKHLIIHIVGADTYEMVFDWRMLTALLGHRFPKTHTYEIYLIGPNMTCDNIVARVSNLTAYRVIGLYHDMIKELPEPHLVVAFNCGIHSSPETWQKSIPALLNKPFILTGYLDEETIADKNILMKHRDGDYVDIIYDCVKNPFASPLAYKNWELCESKVYYVNNYIFMSKPKINI
ncbi:PREDICTED: uncharacterized protein LOC108568080 [Nicrophorus vespilloides]|uniref:Uncharacterized protein LOC108568080 n=1 Tax=Nicrophorus vespilloides TaxID=110193 RepID=A0ABM1NCC8_NICVS|nr:PREDICTED: uncharacterized protein LOC108568080 [Nicrophorus vespilloides]